MWLSCSDPDLADPHLMALQKEGLQSLQRSRERDTRSGPRPRESTMCTGGSHAPVVEEPVPTSPYAHIIPLSLTQPPVPLATVAR